MEYLEDFKMGDMLSTAIEDLDCVRKAILGDVSEDKSATCALRVVTGHGNSRADEGDVFSCPTRVVTADRGSHIRSFKVLLRWTRATRPMNRGFHSLDSPSRLHNASAGRTFIQASDAW